MNMMQAIRDALGLNGSLGSSKPFANPPGRPNNVMPNGRVIRGTAPRAADNVGQHKHRSGGVHMHMQRMDSGICQPMPTPIHRSMPFEVFKDLQYKEQRRKAKRYTGPFLCPVKA